MTSPSDIAKMIQDAGGTVEDAAALPDGSGFMTASFPLPKTHWLYVGSAMRPPMPLRTGTDHPRHHELCQMVREAAQYAVKGATMNGKDNDFDPDALVQNMIVGLLGYHTANGLSSDHDEEGGRYDPKVIPPIFAWPDATPSTSAEV